MNRVIIMSEVTFRIVENYSHEHKFDDFKKDYLDGMTKEDLLKKYDISRNLWFQWKERLPKRNNYRNRRQPRPKIRSPVKDYEFRRYDNGNVAVFRRVNRNAYSYGAYPSMDIAIMVLELLKESDWDIDLAVSLIDKYAVQISRNYLLANIRSRKFK